MSDRRTRQVTTVYLFTDATSHSVPHPHGFVYFCVMTQQNVDGSDRWSLLFSWAYSAQTVHPPPILTLERHIFGMSTSSRNDSHCSKLCRLSCTPITNNPRKYPFSVGFGTCKTPAQIQKCFDGLRMRTPIDVFYFKNSQNRCMISGVELVTEKKRTRFGILRWNPWGDFPYLCECTPLPLT